MTTYAEIMAELDKPAVVGNAVPFTTDATYTRPDHVVVRNGKIFEIGSYTDKAFTFDEKDLESAVANFTPVPVDLEHTDTVLQGKLGHVQRIFPGSDGKSLMGEVHLPAWLDALLESGERKVSATWDRATKRLLGLALVRTPRITDAALMAAFSNDEPQVDQSRIDRFLAHTPRGRQVLRERGIDPNSLGTGVSSTAALDVLRAQGKVARPEVIDRMLAGSPIGRQVLADRAKKAREAKQ